MRHSEGPEESSECCCRGSPLSVHGVSLKFVVLTGSRSGRLIRLISCVFSSVNGYILLLFDVQCVQQKQVIPVN